MGGVVQAYRVLLAYFAFGLACFAVPQRAAAQESAAAASAVPGKAAATIPQSPATAAVPVAYDQQSLPADPVAALELASKVNGLASDDLRPWHLRAHYQTYDPKGRAAGTGVMEVYWASKSRQRVTYSSDAFTQASYVTPDGIFRTGSAARLPYAESLLWGELMYPVDRHKDMPPPKVKERKSGQAAFRCFVFESRSGQIPDEECFDSDRAVLRARTFAGLGSVYNRLNLFQHRFVPNQVSVMDSGDQVLTLTVDDLRGMTQEEMALLTPPPGATLVSKAKEHPASDLLTPAGSSLLANPRLLAGRSVSKEQPRYPSEAKRRRAQGTVRIAATIGKDGFVRDPVVVHNPDTELSGAAVDAVSKWRYQPYLLEGEPVEVQTVITITFRLGG